MIVANTDFQDLEFNNPYRAFQSQSYEITIASGNWWECYGVFGLKIENSLTFNDIEPKDYDAVVFIGGGWAYEQYLWDEKYQEIATQANLLCAICIAPSLLAPSWVFNWKKVTARDDGKLTEIWILKDNWAIWQWWDLVVDWNVITASWPETSLAFGREIIKYLEKKI